MYINNLNSYLDVDSCILININTLEYYEIEKGEVDIVVKYSVGESLNDLERDIINEIRETLFLDNSNPVSPLSSIESVKIHVSNDCNLRCSYCYAEGGAYGKERSIMTSEEAKVVSDTIKEVLPNLKNILYFGREPLMAIDAIETICEEFKNLDIKFFLQTNGTIYSEKIKSLVDKYDIRMTVSIDGTKDIHDKHRVFTNGRGSYDLVSRNIKLFNKDKKHINFIQATYTNQSTNLTRQELAQ